MLDCIMTKPRRRLSVLTNAEISCPCPRLTFIQGHDIYTHVHGHTPFHGLRRTIPLYLYDAVRSNNAVSRSEQLGATR